MAIAGVFDTNPIPNRAVIDDDKFEIGLSFTESGQAIDVQDVHPSGFEILDVIGTQAKNIKLDVRQTTTIGKVLLVVSLPLRQSLFAFSLRYIGSVTRKSDNTVNFVQAAARTFQCNTSNVDYPEIVNVDAPPQFTEGTEYDVDIDFNVPVTGFTKDALLIEGVDASAVVVRKRTIVSGGSDTDSAYPDSTVPEKNSD